MEISNFLSLVYFKEACFLILKVLNYEGFREKSFTENGKYWKLKKLETHIEFV